MPDPLRTAVVGIGHLGRHHARLLAAMDGVSLVAVVDTVLARAEDAAATTGARAITDYRERAEDVDAVVVAVPTEIHRAIALPFLERGSRRSSRSRCRGPSATPRPSSRRRGWATRSSPSVTRSATTLPSAPLRRSSPLPDSSKSIASARFRNAAWTSTSSST